MYPPSASLLARWIRRALPPTLLVLAWLTGGRATAQHTGLEPDFQSWNQLMLDGNLNQVARGLRVSVDLHLRRMNAPLRRVSAGVYEMNPNTVLIVRPSVGYAFRDWGTAWVGYAYVPDFFDDPTVQHVRNIQEHRIWTQLSGKWRVGRLEFGSRTRMEHRFRSDGPGSPQTSNYTAYAPGTPYELAHTHWAHRLRQQLRLAYTVRPGGPWQLIAWDEVFFHLNHTAYPTQVGLDHNRAFVGVGYDLPTARIEVGYLNQYVRRFTDPNQLNHAFAMNVILKFGGSPGAGATPVPAAAPAP